MKICIWCRRSTGVVPFNKKAHTFPDSIGGMSICEDVCDECNEYYGNKNNEGLSVEIVFKEALNLSKALLLRNTGNNYWHRSEFFAVDWKNRIIKHKKKYSTNPRFQEKIGRLFRRGMFKVFLEERQKQKSDALDDRFNFIREFARYDLGDYPIFYHKPKFNWLFFQEDDVKEPIIRFTEHSDEIDEKFRIFNYLIMAKYFVIPTSIAFQWTLENYLKEIEKEDHPMGLELIEVVRFEDIDFAFDFMHES